MSMKNYFVETPIHEWSVKAAFEEIERRNPSSDARVNLRLLKDNLREALASSDEDRVKKATKWLQQWKSMRKELIPKQDKSTKGNKISYNNIHITNCNQNTITVNETDSAAIVIEGTNTKRNATDTEETSSSGYGTWDTQEKPRKKRKYLGTYLAGFYDDSDFGTTDLMNSQWIVDDVNATKAFREFRQITIEGAQMRKYLSNSRVLSLSYIFLLSATDNCAISKIPPKDQRLITSSIQKLNPLSPIGIDVALACREVQIVLVDNSLDTNGVEDALLTIRQNYSSNKSVRVVLRIVSDLLITFLHNNTPKHRSKSEALLIIDNIKPYLMHCLVSSIDSIKYEWLTYHLTNAKGCQVFIPDFVLYLEDFGDKTFEVFFMEVKRKGNYQNNNLEDDIVKLGKEMQIAINKLVKRRVRNPEIVGMLVYDCKATIYKMDLKYDGQYRMMEMSSIHTARDSNDVLLMPVILESMNQVCSIVNRTIKSLYQTAEGDEVDISPFTRKQCDSPVMVNYDDINRNKN